MDMSPYAGSSFLKYDDVRDGPIIGKIAKVSIGKYDRPVLELEDGTKLTLNATNVKTLIGSLGRDNRDWLGHTIEMFGGRTTYQGDDRESVLVKCLTTPTTPPKPRPPEPKPDLDDDIPY